jgi:hypothetical protein
MRAAAMGAQTTALVGRTAKERAARRNDRRRLVERVKPRAGGSIGASHGQSARADVVRAVSRLLESGRDMQ